MQHSFNDKGVCLICRVGKGGPKIGSECDISEPRVAEAVAQYARGVDALCRSILSEEAREMYDTLLLDTGL